MKIEKPTGYKLTEKLKRIRRRHPLTATEQALYHELVSICNEDEWPEVFTCSNDQLFRALNISETTLIAARLTLIQQGLIYYRSGKSKRAFSSYSFTKKLSTTPAIGTNAGTNPLANADTNAGTNPDTKAGDYNKTGTKTETKSKTSVTNVTGDDGSGIQDDPKNPQPERKKGSAQKKKEEPPMEFWAALVAVWFEVNKEKYNGFEPDFDKQDPKHLKDIVTRLKNRAGKQNIDWTEANAVDRLRKYFNHAYQDPWLKTNFLLSNLSKQLEKFEKNESGGITTAAGDGTGGNGRPGQSAGTARGRGGSISDIQNAKRPGTTDNPEREEFTPIEVVK